MPAVLNSYVDSTTWLCPYGTSVVQVQCWGSGGNGSYYGGNGFGGGGGGYSYSAVPVVPGFLYTVNVDSSRNQGASFFSFDSTTYTLANSGLNGDNNTGAGGSLVGAIGDFVIGGGKGGSSTENGGGGGGCGNGSAGDGTNATPVPDPGNGGSGANGGGYGGLGGDYEEDGNPGIFPGGGGGAGGFMANGGVGAPGQVSLAYVLVESGELNCVDQPYSCSFNGNKTRVLACVDRSYISSFSGKISETGELSCIDKPYASAFSGIVHKTTFNCVNKIYTSFFSGWLSEMGELRCVDSIYFAPLSGYVLDRSTRISTDYTFTQGAILGMAVTPSNYMLPFQPVDYSYFDPTSYWSRPLFDYQLADPLSGYRTRSATLSQGQDVYRGHLLRWDLYGWDVGREMV